MHARNHACPPARPLARTHGRTRARAQTHTHTGAGAGAVPRTRACAHACTHIRAHAHTHTYTHTTTHTHTRTQARTHARTHARTRTHTHARKQSNTWLLAGSRRGKQAVGRLARVRFTAFIPRHGQVTASVLGSPADLAGLTSGMVVTAVWSVIAHTRCQCPAVRCALGPLLCATALCRAWRMSGHAAGGRQARDGSARLERPGGLRDSSLLRSERS